MLTRRNGRIVLADSFLWCRPTHRLAGGMVCGADLAAQSDCLGGDAGPEHAGWLLHEASRQASLCESPLTLCLPMPPGVAYDAELVRHAEAALCFWAPETCGLELLLRASDVAQAGTYTLLALSALRDLGYGLALECGPDSATGLARLRRLPLTCLRLPAGVVCDLPHTRQARLAVAQTVREAQNLGAAVLAECVYSAAQRDVLADLGCDRAQGTLFGSPMPAAVFQAALLGDPWR